MTDQSDVNLQEYVDRFLANVEDKASTVRLEELKELWRQVYPADSPESDLGFSVFEESFEAELRRQGVLPDDLEFRAGGWTVDLRGGLARATLTAALLGGVLFAAGVTGLAPVILPAVLPLLVDVSKVRISPSDRKLLAELRTVAPNEQASSDELYARLPPDIRNSLSPLDFADYLGKLHRAGQLTVDKDDVTVHAEGETKFRLSLD